jgi:hypothetical protein
MLWILIVSLPLQGIAAAIAMPCTMAHATLTAPGIQSMEDCDEPEMMMSKAPDHSGADVAQQQNHCDQGAHGTHSSCRACCACSVGASAPPPFAVARAPALRFENNHISPTPSFTGWIPSRIERPPRA